MAQWDYGYVTDVSYTTSFYRELTPAWLGMTSLLLGHRPPDLAAPFHYADVGCGNGFTTLIVAATCPQADVWGFDFNPAHIEFASTLAAQAGLTNAHFVETSFADLNSAKVPAFDLMVSHGVLSWISPANRHELMQAVARHLKPGGLVYLGYNVTTGWASMLPVQALMRMLTAASPERSDLAVAGVLDAVDRLKQAGALYFQAHPGVEPRLTDMRRQDPRYIAHEYLNQDWHPLMFADIAGEMAEAKCAYIGSATLAENIDNVSVPQGVLPILGETRDLVLRETLRDIGCAQPFRRDLFRKGLAPLQAPEQQVLVEQLALAWLGQAVPEGGATFQTPVGTVTGRPEVYQPMVDLLQSGPMTVGRLRAAPEFAGRPMPELMQAFTLMVSGGYAHPMLPEAVTASGREAARRLNQAIAQVNGNGGALPALAAPMIGAAVGADTLETLLVGALLAGEPEDADQLAGDALGILARTGRTVQREGKPVLDTAEARGIVRDAVVTFLDRRVSVLRRLGVLEA
jgi:SAM-dependent methyltransferase